MVKKFFLTALLTGAAVLTEAATLMPEQALERISRSGFRQSVGMKSPPRYAQTIRNLYVFDTADGFLILPDDDRAPAVLGYADSGGFSTEGKPAFKG